MRLCKYMRLDRRTGTIRFWIPPPAGCRISITCDYQDRPVKFADVSVYRGDAPLWKWMLYALANPLAITFKG